MPSSIVSLIDHAVLQPTQTAIDVQAACDMCAGLSVASVCVKPSDVRLAAELLSGSKVAVGTVIGFPHGGATTTNKIAEAVEACHAGATEVDMVINIARALDRSWEYIEHEIAAIAAAARQEGAITKVIFECGLLPDDEAKIALCAASENAGAAFVKTSTGFGFVKDNSGKLISTGATEHDILLMRKHCTEAVQVKASGGIRTYADAEKFVALGATRLGTSATGAIAEGTAATTDY